MPARFKNRFATFGLLMLFAGRGDAVGGGMAPPRPNIIVILSDDMGFSDLGCYGGEIRTPNLDGLASEGLRFTQFYNTARCCPSRAALLTGLYSHQAGVGHMMEDRGFAAYRGDLSPHSATIAQVLGPAGYHCYAVGKWHVTRFTAADGPERNWPLQRGFERYYGTLVGAGNYFHPDALTRGNTRIDSTNDPEYHPRDYYYTDAITDQAIGFISDHVRARAAEPFFLYVAFTAAHWPMHARDEDIARYKHRYDDGYDPIRIERLARLKALGLIDPSWQPAPTVGEWNQVQDKAWESRCMEVYDAMVDRMDQGIGRIVQTLRDKGKLENTLILFLQDNGGCAEEMGRSGPEQRSRIPGGPDSYVAYGRNWANVSNTPFREYKHWVHEGGISTPLIAHWPGGIDPRLRGRLVKDPCHLIDIMATCVDLSGATVPRKIGGETIVPPQGVSLRPTFLGKPVIRSRPIFWEHEGNKAIRSGTWKLVAKHGKPWELHDMEHDRTEMVDLAASRPDLVRELTGRWESWAREAGVRPWDEVARKRSGAARSPAATRANRPSQKSRASEVKR